MFVSAAYNLLMKPLLNQPRQRPAAYQSRDFPIRRDIQVNVVLVPQNPSPKNHYRDYEADLAEPPTTRHKVLSHHSECGAIDCKIALFDRAKPTDIRLHIRRHLRIFRLSF
jgi:hypothetical protein